LNPNVKEWNGFMIDLDKLPQAHIDALLYSNTLLPTNIAELMPFVNSRIEARLDDMTFTEGEEYYKKSLAAVKDILDNKKELFADKGKRFFFSKPSGRNELVAAYIADAEKIMGDHSEFTMAAKNGVIDAGKLIDALKGVNFEAHSDLGRVIAQSIELSYIMEKPFSEVLGERMKEVGMVTRKQARQVKKIVTAYESGNYEHLLRSVATKAAAPQEVAQEYEPVKHVEPPRPAETVSPSAKTAETVAETVKEDSKSFISKLSSMSSGKKWALGGAVAAAAAIGGWAAHENNRNEIRSKENIER
jgi:hypothetical protein